MMSSHSKGGQYRGHHHQQQPHHQQHHHQNAGPGGSESDANYRVKKQTSHSGSQRGNPSSRSPSHQSNRHSSYPEPPNSRYPSSGMYPPQQQQIYSQAPAGISMAPSTGQMRSGHMEVDTLYGTSREPQSLVVNSMNAPNNSTMQCGCENIDCPFCNLMMSVQMKGSGGY